MHAFLQEFNSQGMEPGVVGKKMPLLTRLAGGIRAWRGQPAPNQSNEEASEIDPRDIVEALRAQSLDDEPPAAAKKPALKPKAARRMSADVGATRPAQSVPAPPPQLRTAR